MSEASTMGGRKEILDAIKRTKEVFVNLREARNHYNEIQAAGGSVFIKENGRKGGSPWSELMDAIRKLCDN